uniref:Aldo/keto reductase, putative n=1 Tax=Oryza sativa subsp. japonica TaxID=39947 RepID=Q33BE9_ORYSJ|nr:aldo/keto reductase, putative [Oryza sativa Japonica Group]
MKRSNRAEALPKNLITCLPGADLRRSERLQVEVHPYCRQNKLREFCKGKGIQMCAYSPLGANGTSWCSNVMDCPLKQIALERGKTVAQSFNERRLRENLGIFDWELTDVDHHKISTLPESRGCLDFFVHESGVKGMLGYVKSSL